MKMFLYWVVDFVQLRMDTLVLEKKLCALLVQLGKAHFSGEIVVELVLV